jgi:F-box-like
MSEAKRQKLVNEVEELKIDFIAELPANVNENIFRHLKVKELTNASLVSKNWNAAIGFSSTFSKRVNFTVLPSRDFDPEADDPGTNDSASNSREISKILKASCRRYENLTLTENPPRDWSWIALKPWKNVVLDSLTISSIENFINDFQFPSRSVQALELHCDP